MGGSLPGDPQIIHFPAVVPTTMSAFYHYEGGSLHEHSSHILTRVIGRTYESHTGLDGQSVPTCDLSRVGGTYHLPSHFSHIRPIAIYQHVHHIG